MSKDKFWIEKLEDKDLKKPKIKKPKKVDIDTENVRDGLAQLVLTIVELLREVMEKQAVRRIEGGKLKEEEIERLGQTFRKLREEVNKLKEYFKLKDEDLDLDLGPLGTLRDVQTPQDFAKKVSAVEIIDRLIGKGVFMKGDVIISVADIDLIKLNLGLVLASIDKTLELENSAKDTYIKKIEALENQIKELEEENEKLKG